MQLFIRLKNCASGAKLPEKWHLCRPWAICTKAILRWCAKRKNVPITLWSVFLSTACNSDRAKISTNIRALCSKDADKLAGEGVAVVFAPDEKELYPNVEQRFNVEPPHLQNELCGKFRPGHFRGVATVVTKLFNIVQPNTACFGKKDYQQLAIIKGFVEDLNFNIEIVPVDTGRASDGLALSSRNQYLSEAERAEAPRLYQELQNIATALKNGNLNYAQLEAECIRRLTDAGWVVDYVEIRHAHSLAVAHVGDKELVVLAAARLGTTRLIDNLEVALA